MSTIYRAAVLDLDKTLLFEDISPENQAAVRRLASCRMRVLFGTGRNFHHTTTYYNQLQLRDLSVTSDGALVSVPQGPILAERALPMHCSRKIMEQAKRLEISCLNFFRYGIYVTSHFDWNAGMERHREIGNKFAFRSVQYMSTQPVYKTLLFATEGSRLDDFHSLIVETLNLPVDFIRNGPSTLEYVAKGVNKPAGLDVACDYLGITPAEVAVFGDGPNDKGMFSWAGFSVCMYHGHPDAQAVATMVAPETKPEVNFAAGVDAFLAANPQMLTGYAGAGGAGEFALAGRRRL
jgi:Cof subfamily protein (haloacid dehalogenase superfamily)